MARPSLATRSKMQIAALTLAIALTLKPDARAMVRWSLFGVAIVFVGLLPGVSTWDALLIMFSLGLFWKLRSVVPSARREPAAGQAPPDASAGDRFPRRPLPFRPSGAIARPVPI